MKLKLLIILILIASFQTVFPAFELDFLVKEGLVIGVIDSKYDIDGGFKQDFNLKLGYKFPINKNLFKGISLLFDTGMDITPISYSFSKYNKHTMGSLGVYTGLALEFIFSPSLTSKQDLVVGVASGAKFIADVDTDTKLNKVPISPYVKLFFEDRIYGNDKFAFVVGIGFSYEYMFFDKADSVKLFSVANLKGYHSIGEMISIGFHFGNR